MKRTGLLRFAWTFTILTLGAALLLAPAPAEAQLYRILGISETDGEPTDPDGALLILADVGLDPTESDLSATPPEDQAGADAWWNAIYDLLIQLLGGDTGQ